MKRILAAIDFSDGTEAVLFKTLEMVKAFNAELSIVHAEPEGNVYAREEDNREYLDGIFLRIDLIRKKFQEYNIFPYMKQGSGSASKCILRECERFRPDLVIIGAHKHSKIVRIFSEHIREDLIAKASCPLMLVRPDDHEGSFVSKDLNFS
ncbi:MAG: universal stress protein [Lentisphaerales bacterium]|nr:universal stress protein [Lentisphaerales bacterium]